MKASDRQRKRERRQGVASLFGPEPKSRGEAASTARRRALALVPALFLLGGCGQRGALFLPEEEGDTEEARGAPTSVSAA